MLSLSRVLFIYSKFLRFSRCRIARLSPRKRTTLHCRGGQAEVYHNQRPTLTDWQLDTNRRRLLSDTQNVADSNCRGASAVPKPIEPTDTLLKCASLPPSSCFSLTVTTAALPKLYRCWSAGSYPPCTLDNRVHHRRGSWIYDWSRLSDCIICHMMTFPAVAAALCPQFQQCVGGAAVAHTITP